MGGFFSFEGIEASGKTTVAKGIAARLRADRREVLSLDEFGAAESRRPIDEALSRSPFISEGFAAGPRSALLYMLYHEVTKAVPALAASAPSGVVMADRYVDSICVYQGLFLPGVDPAHGVLRLARKIEGLLYEARVRLPMTTYLLDIPSDLSAKRRAHRGDPQFTSAQERLVRDIRTSYLALAEASDRFVVIDARESLQHVIETVYQDLSRRI